MFLRCRDGGEPHRTKTLGGADQVHVHGFDLTLDLVPAEPANWSSRSGTAPGPELYEHVLGAISPSDRAVKIFPREHALRGQLPLLALMVAYTVTGPLLLFAV